MRVGIIGGGILGMLAAHELMARGCLVTILERGRIGDEQGASKDARMVAVLPQLSVHRALMEYAWDKWQSYRSEGEIANELLHPAKLLELFDTPDAAANFQQILSTTSIEGVAYENEISEVGLRFPDAIGILRDGAFLLSVRYLLRNILRRIIAGNGTAYQGAEVTRIAESGREVEVLVGEERLRFDHVMIASGNWVAGMLDWCGIANGSITASAQPYFDVPSTVSDVRFGIRALPIVFDNRQHHRIMPGLGENSLRLFNALPGKAVEPGTIVEQNDQGEALLSYARSTIRAAEKFDSSDLVLRTCWYVCSQDYLPVVGPSPTNANVSLLIAGCGAGVRTGPGLASALVDQILDVNPQIDLQPYAPGRFARVV